MANESPKISVCIPTYNRARYLLAAVESVRQQTLADYEIIIYDDASTDGTRELVASIPDDRLRYFCQTQNAGIARNRNSCLEVARGQYVAWLDSDDLYLPHMLATQSAVLDQHPNVGLVHGGFEVIDAVGKRLPDWQLPFMSDTMEAGRDAFSELILCNYVTAPTVMVRRACYERVGPYAVELGNFSEDWEMWLRIALHYDFAYTAGPVASYRWHDQSISAATARAGQWTRGELRTLQRIFLQYAREIPGAKMLQRRAQAAVAAKALFRSGEARLRGQRKMALAEVVRALGAAPWLLRSPHSWMLAVVVAMGWDAAEYRHSNVLLNQLYTQVAGTRYGESIRKQAKRNPEWEHVLSEVARIVRRLVPRTALVALVDKWDPTLLGLCRRKGWHFPDLELSPGGYPSDSDGAIAHLQQLMSRGAAYLIFPNASFWWLDYYQGFQQYLDRSHKRLWTDDQCVIYQLLAQ